MPDDCFKFRSFDGDFNRNDDMVRLEELKLVAEMGDPFADVFQELGARKAVVDARAADHKMEVFDDPGEVANIFSEGTHFDFC